MNIESTRDRFEDRAFAQRYIMSIRHRDSGGPLALVSADCPTKAEFLERKPDGQYVDDTLNAMWWSWCEATRRLIDTLPGQAKLAIDTIRAQYGKQSICCGNFVEGHGGDGMLEPPDPARCCEQPEETVGLLLDVVEDAIIRTMLPVPGPELNPDTPPELLWKEIYRLRAAVQGPEGFATWQDAATSERVRANRAEREMVQFKERLSTLFPAGDAKDEL